MAASGYWVPRHRIFRIVLVTLILLFIGIFLFTPQLLFTVFSSGSAALFGSIITSVEEADEPCSPKIDLVFLKTHKCASSTIQNILMRYGYSRKMLFVLGKNTNYIGHPLPFHHTMVPDPSRFGLHYHILTHHTRLDRDEIAKLMPKETIWITILREPVAMFESMFSFYNLKLFFNASVEDFGKLSFYPTEDMLFKRLSNRIGRNQMSFDLGLEIFEFDSRRAVKEFIREIEGIFDLVMIAEKMDESLVLLRKLLCWSVDDVVAFKQNARNVSNKKTMKDLARSRILELNAADKMMYDHFLEKFEQRIEDFGREAMEKEVSRLRQRRQEWYSDCVGNEKLGVNSFNDQVIGFVPKNGSNETCQLLLEQELRFTDLIRNRQRFLFLDGNKAETLLSKLYSNS